MIKVDGHPNLRRDETTGAITNVNNSAYNNYLIRRKNQDAEKDELVEMKEDLDMLKGEISEIKNLLLKIAQK
jgi:hypothetical protein